MSTKSTMLRTMAVVAAAFAAVTVAPGTAQADIARELPGNGEFYYNADKDLLRITDRKDGDYLYAKVGYRSEPCGTVNDACEPPNPLTYRNAQSNAGYHGYHQLRPTGTYVFIKLCNDDFPPDTCTKWFMTTR